MDHMRDDGRSLCRARDLRSDPEIVKAAVSSKGAALEYASADLQADRSIVMQAIQNDPTALRWAAPALQSDRKFVVAALEKDGRVSEIADRGASGYASATKRPPVPKGGKENCSRPTSSVALSKAGVTGIPLPERSRRPSSAGVRDREGSRRRPASALARRTRAHTPLGMRAQVAR